MTNTYTISKAAPTLMLSLLLLWPGAFLSAQAIEERAWADEGLTISVNQDNVFGFNTSAVGHFRLDGTLDFLFYGTFWSNPSFGNLLNGSSTWLQTGLGLRYETYGRRLTLQPSFGFAHGRLLSDGPDGRLAEGIVPSLTVFYNDLPFEVEVSVSYYKALSYVGSRAGDYALYWVLPGVRLGPNVSIGMHYEAFRKTRAVQGNPRGGLYEWLGAYIRFNVRQRYTFRFSGGVNAQTGNGYGRNFYKLALVLPL